MLSIEDLKKKIKIADQKTIREPFATEVTNHPTWFIWSLRGNSLAPEDTPVKVAPDLPRIAFIYVPDAEKYNDALSNVAGLRQFSDYDGKYFAVDLHAYHRAQKIGLLLRSQDTDERMDKVEFQLIDYWDRARVDETEKAFVWMKNLEYGVLKDAKAQLEAFLGEPLQPTKAGLTLAWMATWQGKTGSEVARHIEKYRDEHPGSGVDGVVPEQTFELTPLDKLEKRLDELKLVLAETWDMGVPPLSRRVPDGKTHPGRENAKGWLASINAQKAWDLVGGAKVLNDPKWHEKDPALDPERRPLIAVFDTAINFDHPALMRAWWASEDAAKVPAESLADQLRRSIHGTGCAGLAVGYEPGEEDGATLFRGVAAGCRLMGWRVRAGTSNQDYPAPPKGFPSPWLDPFLCPPENLAEAIRQAYFEPPHANVISLSLQYNLPSSPGQDVIGAAIEEVVKKGCTVVVAAGNMADDNDSTPRFPANVPGVIAVASTREPQILLTRRFCRAKACEWVPGSCPDGVPVRYTSACDTRTCPRPDCTGTSYRPSPYPGSRFGDNVTVAAPGGEGIWSTDVQDFDDIPLGAGDWNYTPFFATSAATPIVAGTVALMMIVNPALKTRPARVSEILRQTSRPMYHAGVPAPPKGRDLKSGYGFGYLDAGAAVELALTTP